MMLIVHLVFKDTGIFCPGQVGVIHQGQVYFVASCNTLDQVTKLIPEEGKWRGLALHFPSPVAKQPLSYRLNMGVMSLNLFEQLISRYEDLVLP
jgi:hypothetical protein